ncbi:MAG: hypothetical protein NTV51_17105 [Verrucomicrobia bacterium]|nr:hypothetical protein [Verrucomicrobiota bacterium]
MGPTPVAATVKAARAPSSTDWETGGVTIAKTGAAATSSFAPTLVTEPAELETTTE